MKSRVSIIKKTTNISIVIREVKHLPAFIPLLIKDTEVKRPAIGKPRLLTVQRDIYRIKNKKENKDNK